MAARCRRNKSRNAIAVSGKSKERRNCLGCLTQVIHHVAAIGRGTVGSGFVVRDGAEKVVFHVRRGLPRGVRGRCNAVAQNQRCRFFPGGKRCDEGSDGKIGPALPLSPRPDWSAMRSPTKA